MSSDIDTSIDSYCADKTAEIPKEFVSRIAYDCEQQCKELFSNTIQNVTNGLFLSSKTENCVNSCNSWTSDFFEIPNAVIETLNIVEKNKSASSDCNGSVSNEGRSRLKVVEDVQKAIDSQAPTGTTLSK